MDILITGGNGLLGRHLIPALQDRGDAVRVLALARRGHELARASAGSPSSAATSASRTR